MINGWRPATTKDTDNVRTVFNYFIENSLAAYNELPVTKEWVDAFIKRAHVFYVYEQGHEVQGFASLNPFRDQPSFDATATITYFILPQAAQKGLGTQILNRLERDAHSIGVEQLLAHISSENKQSLTFHERRGFVHCGRFRRIGRKWNQSFDLVWMQKDLNPE